MAGATVGGSAFASMWGTMGADDLTAEQRAADYFHHIDPGFVNQRLALSAIPAEIRDDMMQKMRAGDDHLSRLLNTHFLVTTLLDVYQEFGAPSLLGAIAQGKPRIVFRGVEKLAPCPEVYTATRVEQQVLVDVDIEKPVHLRYHTEHICSDTGRMTLAEGAPAHVEAIVGLLHDRGDHFEVQPIVMGAPTLEHPRNDGGPNLMWLGWSHAEILPEDIAEFSRLTEVQVESATEWMDVMRDIPEEAVKEALASLLGEPTKKDWGGEQNDHFSASVTVGGRRRTAAFLLKGPARFQEMTLDMCGKRADQILRLADSHADVSVVQHAHLIGAPVRETLRRLTAIPGRPRKYCFIDGQATFRILRAYGLI